MVDTGGDSSNDNCTEDGPLTNVQVTDICSDHNLLINYFCRPCNHVVCPACRKGSHKGHRTRPIKAIVHDRRQQIYDSTSKFRQKTSAYFESQQRKVARNIRYIDNSSVNTIGDINRRADELRDQIIRMENCLVGDVETKHRQAIERMKEYTSILNKEKAKAESTTNSATDILDTESHVGIVRNCSSILEAQDYNKWISTFSLPDMIEINFQQGDLQFDKVKTGFGFCTTRQKGLQWSRSVSICQESMRLGHVKVELIKKFSILNTDHSHVDNGICQMSITSLVSNNDNTVTVCVADADQYSQLMIFDTSGQLLHVIDTQAEIDDIVRCTVNDESLLFLSSFSSKTIQQVKDDDTLENHIDLKALRPRGICYSDTNEGLLVCAVDQYSTSVGKGSRRTVIQYNGSGETAITHEHDKSGERLFTRPHRVIENSGGDICVVDKTSMGSGRIVVITKSGRLKFVYEGKENTKDRPFLPSDLSRDHKGGLLVADTNNSCVHIVDAVGKFIGLLLERSDGLTSPCAIDLSDDNILWIAMDNTSICCFRYHLT